MPNSFAIWATLVIFVLNQNKYNMKPKVNMKTKTSILAVTKAFFILLVMCCFSCQKYKPELKYPVVYVDTSEQKHARWSESVKTIVLKDANGELQELYTQRGYYDRWTDSIYHHCKIGDTIK